MNDESSTMKFNDESWTVEINNSSQTNDDDSQRSRVDLEMSFNDEWEMNDFESWTSHL